MNSSELDLRYKQNQSSHFKYWIFRCQNLQNLIELHDSVGDCFWHPGHMTMCLLSQQLIFSWRVKVSQRYCAHVPHIISLFSFSWSYLSHSETQTNIIIYKVRFYLFEMQIKLVQIYFPAVRGYSFMYLPTDISRYWRHYLETFHSVHIINSTPTLGTMSRIE